MTRMLIWKEWHEQRWKLALGCIVLTTFAFVGLRTRLVMDEIILVMNMLLGGFLLPLFVGMDLVAAERADGTLPSLLNLPCRPWRILAVKMAMGIAVCVVPILTAGAVAGWYAGGREVATWHIVRLVAATVGLAVTVLIWMTAFGIRQRSEAHAAMVGVAILIAWVLIVPVWEPYEQVLPEWVVVLHPASFLVAADTDQAHRLPAVFLVQMPLVAALLAWAGIRFSKLGRTSP